ncbi:hypothetical protein B0H13DRAFT_2027817 [Mycena leptocephala]|nr:hypothetical protein B0H13DRAFT_2027817 [Mycena leptocephala]
MPSRRDNPELLFVNPQHLHTPQYLSLYLNVDSTASTEPCPPKSAVGICGPSVDQCVRRTTHPPAFGIVCNELCPPVDFYWGHLPADNQTSPLIQDILNTEQETLVPVYSDSSSRDQSPWSQTGPLNPLTERLTTQPARAPIVKVEPFELSLPPQQYLPVASTSSSQSPSRNLKRKREMTPDEIIPARVTSPACACQPPRYAQSIPLRRGKAVNYVEDSSSDDEAQSDSGSSYGYELTARGSSRSERSERTGHLDGFSFSRSETKKRRTFKPASSSGKGSSETRSSRSASPKPITPPCGDSSWTQIGKEKYKCPCGTPFTRLADLHRHQKPDPRTCPICGAILSRKDALRRHLAVKHSLSDATV